MTVISIKGINALLMYEMTQRVTEDSKAKFRCDSWGVRQAHWPCKSLASM